MIFALVLLVVGLLFSWLAILGWRHRKDEMVSIAEAAILKTTGAEPLPLTKFDRVLQRLQLVMISLFGPLLIVIGGYGLFSGLDLL
ncbi:hypothetical protein [Croceicoccus naphthovorans]|uniref:Uncharacterized protein n=1 Tax=Croceicoccus naphthovorans TaxID=1348774 RepID=A0A0G3XI50_9SPHN|nr:hypothetical protein [Croceicoccus naphthovorans]AKM10882.1 hypothetical protein AB433_14365 [Croceicoccus naphthovorans]MBB3989113.1 multisubunit Na+/H+ antiporter MnhG subunit [Croceicoccus naphthovorans]